MVLVTIGEVCVEMIKGLVEVPQPEAAMLLEAGYFFVEMGKHKEAEDVFSGVAALLPHSDVPHVALGNLEFTQGHYARALKHHQEAARLKPTQALAHAHIGECLLWLNKANEGVASLQKAIALEPESAAAKMATALLEAHEQGDLSAARAR
jgi:tetratricopeptide (TPR) repeat protein